MKKLLRYNSRHYVFFPRGYQGKHLPQLNPISSCSHGAKNKRTIYLHEPLWLYRLRLRIFCNAGAQRCGRRGENYLGQRDTSPTPDLWHRGPDGFRTCSYCGSLHYDDFIELCRRALTQDGYRIEPSDKRYKIYVTQPGVRNASEGAIKFYTMHGPEAASAADEALYVEAVRLSRIRYDAILQSLREGYQERKH